MHGTEGRCWDKHWHSLTHRRQAREGQPPQDRPCRTGCPRRGCPAGAVPTSKSKSPPAPAPPPHVTQAPLSPPPSVPAPCLQVLMKEVGSLITAPRPPAQQPKRCYDDFDSSDESLNGDGEADLGKSKSPKSAKSTDTPPPPYANCTPPAGRRGRGSAHFCGHEGGLRRIDTLPRSAPCPPPPPRPACPRA